jgi:uncharacterized protein
MKLSRFLVPIGILLTLTALAHRYVWLRLVRDAAWPPPVFWALTTIIIVMGVTIPFLFVLMRSAPRAWVKPISWVGYSWMGILFYLLLFSGLGDLAKGMAWLFQMSPQSPEAQWMWNRTTAVGIVFFASTLGLIGLFTVFGGFKIRRVEVPLEKLPTDADGFTIALLSDIHVGPTVGRAFIENMVRETNALQPDLIAITGDLVDGSVEQLAEHVEPMRHLKAKYGVFFVTGNHEYYSGVEAWVEHLQNLGIQVLRNEHSSIGGFFDLAGVDDYTAARMHPDHGQDISKAVSGRNPQVPLVLMAHQPKAAPEAVQFGVDLQLSGHVHGGQIAPFQWLTRLDQPLVRGLYRRDKSWIYVSEGTGYWGPPMRVGTRCEIALLTLRNAKKMPRPRGQG